MKLIAVVVALGSLGACSKKDSPPEDKPASGDVVPAKTTEPSSAPSAPAVEAEPPADNRCEITVDGDVKDHGFGKGGPSAVGSDYWMSEEELRKGLEVMAGAFGDKKRDIDADMKKDPRIYTLLMNCQTPKTHVSLIPSEGSKYADVPFGPKKYKIADNKTDKGPGVIHTLVTFDSVKGVWNVDGAGELDVTKFDKTGIAGTFHFDMIEHQWGTPAAPPRKVKITGRFAFKCSLGTSVCNGT